MSEFVLGTVVLIRSRLDRTLPGSRGVRRLEEANLFFPEEMPDLIAKEAEMLWNLRR